MRYSAPHKGTQPLAEQFDALVITQFLHNGYHWTGCSDL